MNRLRNTANRRGAALVAAIILLGITGMAVGSAVVAAGDDAQTSALRADSLRAFYATESGVEFAIHALNTTPATPFTGPVALPGGASVLAVVPFVAAPETPTTATLAGSAGQAHRHITINVQ